MDLPIYLDYMATTPVDPKVIEKMLTCLDMSGGLFANPASSTHIYGYLARMKVEEARKQVADLIHADPREIVWTSGATEADNLAIHGVCEFYQRQGKHIITMQTEHKAVLDTCQYLESVGFEVTYLAPEKNGLLDLEKFKDAIRKDTTLASIMHVNNETGVIQDIAAIGDITRKQGVLLHVDAAQSVGKIPIDMRMLNVDLLSISAHKMYGPKGIGALYVRRKPRVRLTAQIHGGGHEQGMRSGTLATHQIVGMGEACALAARNMQTECERISKMREQLWQGMQAIGGIILNGHPTLRVSGCLNITVNGVDGESLLLALRKIAASTGSACNSANPKPSHVLKAMGVNEDAALRSIRISLGRFTTEENVLQTISHFQEVVNQLCEMSPLWDETTAQVVKKHVNNDGI